VIAECGVGRSGFTQNVIAALLSCCEILITANSQEWTDWETPGKIRPIAPRHVPQVSQRKKARRDALLATKSVSVILNGRQADDDGITFQAGFKSSNSIFLSGQFPEPPRTGIPYVLSRRAVSYDNSAYKTVPIKPTSNM
jgi:hypothetical protein